MLPSSNDSRIACVNLPLFPLAARLRCEPDLLREALAIFEGNGSSARVVAATRLARQAGVKPGMTLTQARARMPKLIARSRDLECESTAREVLLEICEAMSPRVEEGPEGMAFLDATGLDRHFRHAPDSPERELGRELIRQLDRVGLPARVGIASSKLAARVAAGSSGSPIVVENGSEASFLAPLPLQRLSPEMELGETLERWGIATIGEFAKLPKEEVASRLGTRGQELHLTARGIDPSPLIARQPPAALRESLTLEWPVVNLEPFLFIARTALERLCQRLDARGLGCKRLELSLQLEPDGFFERSIELPSPTREARTLLTLLRLDLEAHPPGSPVIGFQLSAQPDTPKLAQMSLLGPSSLSPDRLATTIARLFAILGPNRVGSPRLANGHDPSRLELVEYVPPPSPKIRTRVEPGRGLLAVRVLRPAVELEVITNEPAPDPVSSRPSTSPSEVAEPSVMDPSSRDSGVTHSQGIEGLDRQNGLFRRNPRFCYQPLEINALVSEKGKPKIQGTVRIASGPWELEEKWWSENRTERDYWDVELSDGAIYRLYRDRSTGDWFADGIYD